MVNQGFTPGEYIHELSIMKYEGVPCSWSKYMPSLFPGRVGQPSSGRSVGVFYWGPPTFLPGHSLPYNECSCHLKLPVVLLGRPSASSGILIALEDSAIVELVQLAFSGTALHTTYGGTYLVNGGFCGDYFLPNAPPPGQTGGM
jgi:hypothetical protein